MLEKALFVRARKKSISSKEVDLLFEFLRMQIYTDIWFVCKV